MRGSFIQEFFRVVNEIHSSAIKNQEWQEKLPVIVLKAEEIMYSKANSEAEYMDLKTLWDRTNDAINTIIRRDESTETGELLPPCIEAALNLGCTPRRSQRNSNLRCYLNPGPREAGNIARGNGTENSHCIASYSGFMKPTLMNATHLGFTSENGSLPSNNPCLPIEKVERAKTGYIHNLFVDSLNKMNQTDAVNASMNPHEFACDLSLRLGPLSTPCSSVRNGQLRETGKSNSTFPEWKLTDKSSSSFLKSNGDDRLNSTSNERSFEGESMNVDATMRKRKTIYGLATDQQFHSPSKLPYGHLIDSVDWPTFILEDLQAFTWRLLKNHYVKRQSASEPFHRVRKTVRRPGNVLEKAKREIDAVRSVSWADMIAVAGAEAVSVRGGPKIPVYLRPTGFRPNPEGKLPQESLDAAGLKQCFQRKGFSTQELVTLSGAHTIGGKGFGSPVSFDKSILQNSSGEAMEFFRLLSETNEGWSSFGKEHSTNGLIGSLFDRRRWIMRYAGDQNMFFEDFKNAHVKLVNCGARWKSM
ncbi:putative L-ascorbate peroxidase 6 [Hibiscus syriacus]|uniref:L-ascorbate peroxidase n=1 Tax=Hibiscus syriacus TaxID=106335 RepID=A0A6A3D3P4_HIBSY|nr:putative L-ascorbate peroxidase 6 [Hibiscus syriacus]